MLVIFRTIEEDTPGNCQCIGVGIDTISYHSNISQWNCSNENELEFSASYLWVYG